MQSARRSAAAARPCQASIVVLRLQPAAGGPPLFRSYSLSGPLSTERYRISVKIEPNGAGRNLPPASMSGSAMRSTSARRAAASFCSPASGRWCCSARASARRRCWRCCTRWPRPARRGRSCGCTGLAIGEHHPFAAEVRRLMLALPHGRSYVCYSRPAPHDKIREGLRRDRSPVAIGVRRRSALPREADVYLCGPTRFMADMKEALATFGVAPERIHVEIFNGSESMTPGCRRRADASSASARGRRPIPVRWSRSRAAASPRTGTRRATRAFWSWPKRATCRSGGRAGPALSQLRERPGVGSGRLRTGAARPARRRQPSRLLLTADGDIVIDL